MFERQEGGNPRAHRIAHDIGPLDLEMVEQRGHVGRHCRGVIIGRVIELARTAMAAVIERDDATTGTLKRREPAGLHPVYLLRGSKSVNQHHRRAQSLVEEGELHGTMMKNWHDNKR